MKKMLALFAAMLLMSSIIPMAFAESGSSGNAGQDSEEDGSGNVSSDDAGNESALVSVPAELSSDADAEIESAGTIDDVSTIEVSSEPERVLCVDKLSEKFPDAPLKDVRNRCLLRKLSGSDAAGRMLAIREHQRTQLQNAIDKCKDLNLENCEERLQKRLQLVEKLGEKDLERLSKLEQRRERVQQEFKELSNETNFNKYSSNKRFKARELAKDIIEKVKAKFSIAKSKFFKAKERYAESKEKVKDLKERKQACLDDESGDECKSLKSDSKAFLLDSADLILTNLETLRAKVESSEDLSDDEASNMLSDIDSAITQVDTIKSKIDALADDAPRREVNALAKDLRNTWAKVKRTVNYASGHTVNSKIGGIIIKSKQLEVKLNRVLERMAEEGIGTTEVSGLVDEFKLKLDEAKSSYDEAVANYKAAKSSTSDSSIKDAAASMKKAHAALKEAHSKLKEIMMKLRTLKADKFLEEVDATAAAEDALATDSGQSASAQE